LDQSVQVHPCCDNRSISSANNARHCVVMGIPFCTSNPPGCAGPVFARSRAFRRETGHAFGVSPRFFIVHFQGRRYQMAASIVGPAGPVKGLDGADYGP
jgi:hypothetical protein